MCSVCCVCAVFFGMRCVCVWVCVAARDTDKEREREKRGGGVLGYVLYVA